MEEDKILDAEKDFRIEALNGEIKRLKQEITRCKILLDEVDANPDDVSTAEVICVQQLEKLKESSKNRELTGDEVKNLDVLHKNLKIARGESTRVGGSGKVKKMTSEDLEKLVNEN
jgi:hypothetical protein